MLIERHFWQRKIRMSFPLYIGVMSPLQERQLGSSVCGNWLSEVLRSKSVVSEGVLLRVKVFIAVKIVVRMVIK